MDQETEYQESRSLALGYLAAVLLSAPVWFAVAMFVLVVTR